MGQEDTVLSGAETRREIRPRTWEFPDPRVAVLALLIAVALLLQGRFGALTPVGMDEPNGSASEATTARR